MLEIAHGVGPQRGVWILSAGTHRARINLHVRKNCESRKPEAWRGCRSPVSRILSTPCGAGRPFLSLRRGGAPCLRRMRLIPGDERTGSPSPVLSCTTRGLPSRLGYPKTRWALTPPFQPYLCLTCVGPSAVFFLLHFPSRSLAVPVPHFHEARCPVVSGLSSALLAQHCDRPGSGTHKVHPSPRFSN